MQSPSNQPANKPIQFNPLVFCSGLVLFLIIITCIIIIGVTLKSKLSKTNKIIIIISTLILSAIIFTIIFLLCNEVGPYL